ncbi:MAG: Trk system potassium transporter TrkA [Clostridia bacterium]|nr:Trk system potassium transporter TrkA [Clostridia bacterium]
MNIVIVGAGSVGSELVEQLIREGHNITVIDSDQKNVQNAVNRFDVNGFVGNGGSLDTLLEAGIKNCDIFIAVTEKDEINVLACMVAKSLGIDNTVARVRNPEYISMANETNNIGISMMVNPEYQVSEEILNILQLPSAINIHNFSDGNADLVETKIKRDSILNGVTIKDLHLYIRQRILICAVLRNNEIIIPNGDIKLREDDIIYFSATERNIRSLFQDLKINKKTHKVFIAGGSKITYYLAKGLDRIAYNVKIVSPDKDECKFLADNLNHIDVIHGDPSDQALLNSEGYKNADAFIALTDNDETNIMLSTYAHSSGVRKVITKVDNDAYLKMTATSPALDTIISAKLSTAEQIVTFVRTFTGEEDNIVKKIHKISDDRAEALEFTAGETFGALNTPLKDIKFKKNVLIGGIIREGEFILPTGNDEIKVADSVIVVTTNNIFDDLNDILG